jgi:hypothetical protein
MEVIYNVTLGSIKSPHTSVAVVFAAVNFEAAAVDTTALDRR